MISLDARQNLHSTILDLDTRYGKTYKFFLDMKIIPGNQPPETPQESEKSVIEHCTLSYQAGNLSVLKKISISENNIASELLQLGKVLFDLDPNRNYKLYCTINSRGIFLLI